MKAYADPRATVEGFGSVTIDDVRGVQNEDEPQTVGAAHLLFGQKNQ